MRNEINTNRNLVIFALFEVRYNGLSLAAEVHQM